MNKRGQATLFIILGIVLVIAIAVFFVATRTEIIPPLLTPSDASAELSNINEHLEECLEEVGTEYVTLIAAQGGYIEPNPDTFRIFNDSSVGYLCWNQIGQATCTNRLLTINQMEEDLSEAINNDLENCIDVTDFSDNANTPSAWDLTVDVTQNSVDLELFYPVSITKGDQTATEDTFTHSLDVPLGELYDVAQDAINEHATVGDFDQLFYILGKVGRYTIYKHKPYPDVVYQVKLRNDDYTFQFAIQGEENV